MLAGQASHSRTCGSQAHLKPHSQRPRTQVRLPHAGKKGCKILTGIRQVLPPGNELCFLIASIYRI